MIIMFFRPKPNDYYEFPPETDGLLFFLWILIRDFDGILWNPIDT